MSATMMTTTTPSASASSLSIAHLVIPGQVIATSSSNNKSENDNGNENNSNNDEGFLRGHGTYVESSSNKGNEERLISSVCGIIHRVNKLITVIPYNESIYKGNVGDLVIGRISSVSSSRWTVIISNSSCMKDAQLPLSGVHLPGGVQRLRTKQDSLNMSTFLTVGDLICSEVHKVQQNDGGSLSLHTRSHKYTKLENGILVKVPSCLIARRKSHILSMINNKIDVLWGVNGNIWLQRAVGSSGGTGSNDDNDNKNTTSSANSASDTIADLQEKMRLEHSTTPISLEIRCILARLRNSIECLRIVHTMCTPENTESVYYKSLSLETTRHTTQISNMLLPENIILLTNEFRS